MPLEITFRLHGAYFLVYFGVYSGLLVYKGAPALLQLLQLHGDVAFMLSYPSNIFGMELFLLLAFYLMETSRLSLGYQLIQYVYLRIRFARECNRVHSDTCMFDRPMCLVDIYLRVLLFVAVSSLVN